MDASDGCPSVDGATDLWGAGGANYRCEILPFQLTFADKRTNCCGLQLADLFARPIGRKTMRPDEANRAFEIINRKFYNNCGKIEGLGLKIFP